IVQPLPVQELSVNAEGLLRWLPQLDSLEISAVPTYYMVYIQANDGEWDVQQVEKKTELLLDLKPNVKYNFYVVAGNDGGLSLPSPIISAYLNHQSPITRNEVNRALAAENNQSPILIIDAFDDVYGPEWFADSTYAGIVPGSYACEDGFSCAYIGQQWDYVRSSKWLNDDNCGFGACYRDFAGRLTIGNTHDYAAQHGHVLRKMRISYVSCTAGMAQVDSTYALIDVVCGRQRQPLSDTLRSMLADYLTSGGKLLMSTDHFSAIEPAWAKQYLHATYHAPRATRSGRINSPRHRLYQLQLEPNEEQLFTCTPEALRPVEDAQAVATYEDMRCAAGVGYQSPITNDQLPMTKTLVYGFPLEAVMDFEKIYRHAIEWLFAE
ncbi:MAG: fibronectin type III domain-containing protein, partial [Paludibacteraceae bacterium]|nr:fibronectin type III domain-containing protein [Paludibacteraceae bacterium]